MNEELLNHILESLRDSATNLISRPEPSNMGDWIFVANICACSDWVFEGKWPISLAPCPYFNM